MTTHVNEPVLIDIRGVARLLGCSARHVEDLVREKKAPEPIRLGRLRKWRPESIIRWVEAGCPAPQPRQTVST
jgi:predicted DNA-binding transcriptional regulator AlpA